MFIEHISFVHCRRIIIHRVHKHRKNSFDSSSFKESGTNKTFFVVASTVINVVRCFYKPNSMRVQMQQLERDKLVHALKWQ